MKQRKKGYIRFILFLITIIGGVAVSCVTEEVKKGRSETGYIVLALGDINKDNVLYEDKGTEVRMLVFDPPTGECLYNTLLSFHGGDLQQRSIPIEMDPGTYHFLFIANESSYSGFSTHIAGVTYFSELSAPYFKQLVYDPTFMPSTTRGFLMSAYYTNINIVSGHTLANPQVISVDLLRSMAKVEVIFKNYSMTELTTKRLTEVYLEQVPQVYSLPATSDLYNYSSLSLTESTKVTGTSSNPIFGEVQYAEEEVGRLVFYTTEFLRSPTDITSTNTSLVIKGRSVGSDFKVILDHQIFESDPGPRGEFISTNYSNFSIVRGTHYQITVNLTPLAGPVEVLTKVLPWSLKTSKLEFNNLVFVHKVEVGGVNVTSTGLAGKEIALKSGQSAKFTFELLNPVGNLWRATLTNGGDFRFATGSVTEGITEPGQPYVFTIEPSRPWDGGVKYTEVYIAIEGEEAELLGTGLHGPGSRYRLRQIE